MSAHAGDDGLLFTKLDSGTQEITLVASKIAVASFLCALDVFQANNNNSEFRGENKQ